MNLTAIFFCALNIFVFLIWCRKYYNFITTISKSLVISDWLSFGVFFLLLFVAIAIVVFIIILPLPQHIFRFVYLTRWKWGHFCLKIDFVLFFFDDEKAINIDYISLMVAISLNFHQKLFLCSFISHSNWHSHCYFILSAKNKKQKNSFEYVSIDNIVQQLFHFCFYFRDYDGNNQSTKST